MCSLFVRFKIGWISKFIVSCVSRRVGRDLCKNGLKVS